MARSRQQMRRDVQLDVEHYLPEMYLGIPPNEYIPARVRVCQRHPWWFRWQVFGKIQYWSVGCLRCAGIIKGLGPNEAREFGYV
jgi:hypothetical protein